MASRRDVGFDVDGAVNTHGKGGAESVLHAGQADTNGDDFSFDAALAKAEGFLDAVLVHGVHDELAVFENDRVVCDMYTLFRVENLANERQNAHGSTIFHFLLLPVGLTF